jgi:hypothetical protein
MSYDGWDLEAGFPTVNVLMKTEWPVPWTLIAVPPPGSKIHVKKLIGSCRSSPDR